jgi:hypothetical protein
MELKIPDLLFVSEVDVLHLAGKCATKIWRLNWDREMEAFLGGGQVEVQFRREIMSALSVSAPGPVARRRKWRRKRSRQTIAWRLLDFAN